MRTYPDDVLAPAAALNELAALGLAETATFLEGVGQTALADLLREQVRAYRTQAIQLRALDAANRHLRSGRD
jgi:predicted DNA-binding transcriptional regulator YafY